MDRVDDTQNTKGWPDKVLPRVILVPDNLLDCQCYDLEPCRCRPSPGPLQPEGPFFSKGRCFACLKPVMSTNNCTKLGQWKYLAYKVLQRSNLIYWSGLPSVRVVDQNSPGCFAWWDEYASFKYGRPARNFLQLQVRAARP